MWFSSCYFINFSGIMETIYYSDNHRGVGVILIIRISFYVINQLAKLVF